MSTTIQFGMRQSVEIIAQIDQVVADETERLAEIEGARADILRVLTTTVRGDRGYRVAQCRVSTPAKNPRMPRSK